ncbi:hypothetical protein [Streptomyces sp. SID3343]|uniref:hypothetical protein n=1 Tax=Streptomyces sp. SID3343 TaxID=2690260 RepID=UPI00136C3E59|nr:hypothetical protein [Streptomyces sp. SID3343]MYW03408.1 hypothetical protein [Streptomyces sp. SID3343]
MKQRDLVRRIREAAAGAGLSYETGHGGSHDWLSVDGKKVAFPRHSEINELTARGILKFFEDKFGKDWWK